MLYAFSTDAAAAMSAASQLAFFLQLLYQMPSQGAGILVAQRLGAGKREEAESYAWAGIVMVLTFSVIVSMSYISFSGAALGFFSLAPGVRAGAVSFLSIYGGASSFMALNIAGAVILRSWGHTRDVMVANICALCCTIAGNYLALFGPFGLPVLGLAGVAASNVAGQMVASLILVRAFRRRGIRLGGSRSAPRLPRNVIRGILAIGVPTAGENISYNLSQVVIAAIISGMGTAALAAYGLVIALSRYVFTFGISVGMAAQIRVGWLVGAGHHEDASRSLPKWLGLALAISAALAVILNVVKLPLIALFTHDTVIGGMAASVLLVAVVYEPGRCLNTVIIPSLKGAGDVRFPVAVGLVFMWGISVSGAWLLGRVLGLGLLGVWIAMCTDECLRGLVMLGRWQSGRWKPAAGNPGPRPRASP